MQLDPDCTLSYSKVQCRSAMYGILHCRLRKNMTDMTTTDRPRLIETEDFPLAQTSLNSVHEKNVRHGHISTLHIWPARRPLAACRAALIATLLPAPSGKAERQEYARRLGGVIEEVVKRKAMPGGRMEELDVQQTQGGILHWGQENGPDLEWFREKIRAAYGGQAPRVLDPFAGGGAIPLEAMRLGCAATAADINPVAWFLLRCTLEYPQRLAGQTRPLPEFALKSAEFLEALGKGGGLTPRQRARRKADLTEALFPVPDADLSWHIRAWGGWVLRKAKQDLARFYPAVDGKPTVAYLWARTVPCKHCGAELPLLKTCWLARRDNKRVLLTLSPKADRSGVRFGVEENVPPSAGNAAGRREADKRLGRGTMNRNGAWCPVCGGPDSVAMTSDDIRRAGQSGKLGAVLTAVVVQDEKVVTRYRASGAESTSLLSTKSYRLPTADEVCLAAEAKDALADVFAEIPFGVPDDPLPGKEALGFRVPLYGLTRWSLLFTPRQLLALGVFVTHTRAAHAAMLAEGYPAEWAEAVTAYLATAVDRLAERGSSICHWDTGYEKVVGTFQRFALPMSWDFVEASPTGDKTGGWSGAVDWVAQVAEHAMTAGTGAPEPCVMNQSALRTEPTPGASADPSPGGKGEDFALTPPAPLGRGAGGLGSEGTGRGSSLYDLVVTDPPYYDAIPYSDLMDFFYVWLRRTLYGLSPAFDNAFRPPLAPKWNSEAGDGELIDDASRFGGDKKASRRAYEDGMEAAFRACRAALKPEGRMVVVFAHKDPVAWEALLSGLLRAGFTVDASWPIQTEMGNRTRAQSSAALSSSVWLVCKPRPLTARPGWDTQVLEEMREKIEAKMPAYWDAGIKGPDFIWAATGPALEAYSRFPLVRRTNQAGETLTVDQFLQQVRRLVVNYAVGRVLEGDDAGQPQSMEGNALDSVTAYYLLHRHAFGLGEVPVGPCILYATSCGLRDADLLDRYDLLLGAGSGSKTRLAQITEDDADDVENEDDWEGEGGGSPAEDNGRSRVRLKPWTQRRRASMGYDPTGEAWAARQAQSSGTLFPENEPEAPRGRAVPLIDQAHRLMHLWRAGNLGDLNDYIQHRDLTGSRLFPKALQALRGLADRDRQEEERGILDLLLTHLGQEGSGRARPARARTLTLPTMAAETEERDE